MTEKKIHAVTGAFGYSGKYIAQKLLAQGKQVITLTGHPERPNPFGEAVKPYPFDFDQPEKLAETLKDVHTLYNTYWVRFDHANSDQLGAVANTRSMIQAAKNAGVQRIVHISITNPDINSKLAYFKGKAQLEETVMQSGIPYTILRPAILFGKEDVLINNISWFLRRFPVFGIPGDGKYKLQPIYVEDLAKLAVEGGMSRENKVIDAIGPETFTFNELMSLLKKTVNSKALLINMPSRIAYISSRMIGLLVRDIIMTWDEVLGLQANKLVTDSAPSGETKLSVWAAENVDHLGVIYANELTRHF